jgi:Fusaric acid resistance protein-like
MQNLVGTVLSDTLRALRSELSCERGLEHAPKCTAAVIATALAVYVSHWLGLREIWWSAVCAFAITGQDMKTSLNQGMQQILGTVGGTAVGLVLSYYVVANVGLFVISITCVAAIGLYLATSRAASYMWILATALAIYVISAAHSSTGTLAIARALSANAIVGTAAYWGVNQVYNRVMSAAGLLRATPEAVPAMPSGASFDIAFVRARNVLVGTLTTSVLAYLAYRYPVDGFAQAMTTALVILVIRLDVHRDRSTYVVVLRMFHRLLGCFLGSVMACVALPIASGNMFYCTIALCIAIWFSCHLRFGDTNIAYAGTQSGAVVILAFVHDQIWFSDQTGLAYARLTGIASGTIALAIMLAVVGSLFSCSRFSKHAD